MKSKFQTSKPQINPKTKVPISKQCESWDLGIWIYFEVWILILGFAR